MFASAAMGATLISPVARPFPAPTRRFCVAFATAAALAGCAPAARPALEPLPPLSGRAGVASPRVSGRVGTTEAMLPAQVSYGSRQAAPVAPARPQGGAGSFSLDFADTDIREVAAQILGTMLRVNYAIDPAVHGTATLHTVRPLQASELLPTLQVLLAQAGATLVQSGSLYRVVPAAAATEPALAGAATAGSVVLPLRYASAETLARLLQPYAGKSGKIIAEPGRNALVISGEPEVRATLAALVQAFDVDALAGQSYALLPVASGSAKDFASALQDAFRSQRGEPLAGMVRAVPLERINSVLLVAGQPRYIDDARRVYGMIARTWRNTVRSWHVYYLQNSRSDDVAYLLQQAFTPGQVTARPTERREAAPGQIQAQIPGQFGGITGGGVPPGLSGFSGGIGTRQGFAQGTAPMPGQAPPGAPGAPEIAEASPLLGGLGTPGGAAAPEGIRIIPDGPNNALMIYATPREEETIMAMLHKVDILPLQVRIDAVIAEVTLNDTLQYGTQWFFKSGGVNGVLSAASGSLGPAGLAAAQLSTNFPGFVVGGNGQGGAPFVISALQAVTTVRVLSSPEIMVLDNRPASLMVGSLVPYLTASTTSTLTALPTITNSIEYQPTGVIMQVTPHVNSGGLVTLDVQQQVSSVASTTTAVPGAPGINSPTFNQRQVVSRVVVQDGQTIGLAGLITDSVTRGNQGIPWLKDIPLLGFLAGQQGNQRNRTELLVLITPHVMYDQQDARALTQDLRDQLGSAAFVPQEMRHLPASGSSDPNLVLRRRLHLE